MGHSSELEEGRFRFPMYVFGGGVLLGILVLAAFYFLPLPAKTYERVKCTICGLNRSTEINFVVFRWATYDRNSTMKRRDPYAKWWKQQINQNHEHNWAISGHSNVYTFHGHVVGIPGTPNTPRTPFIHRFFMRSPSRKRYRSMKPILRKWPDSCEEQTRQFQDEHPKVESRKQMNEEKRKRLWNEYIELLKSKR